MKPNARQTIFGVVFLFLLVAGAFAIYKSLRPKGTVDPLNPPRVTVRFAMLPYGDHTYAIIGVRKGWFEEVGITLDYQSITVDQAVPFLKNGSVDVASCPPGIIAAAYETNPGVGNFVFGSIFQGYAIMAQPDRGYKSVDEFIAEGLSPNDAIQAAAKQLTGRVFAYPSEAAIKPFIDLVIQQGGLSRNAFKALVLDDSLTVNAMRNKQADFQVGGAPSHVVLQREGFKPIITSNDIVRAAKPAPDSPELASVFTDGWATTSEYYKRNYDTVLRLASVNFRITKLMNDHQDEALALHMPYLTQVTGQSFTAADGKAIYDSLDPFFTFEAQRDWYHNPQSPYYFRNLNGSLIGSFVTQGIYKKPPPSVDDIIYADDVYYELERLKTESDALFSRIQEGRLNEKSTEASDLYTRAKSFYDAYNYLDSKRLAERVIQLTQSQ